MSKLLYGVGVLLVAFFGYAFIMSGAPYTHLDCQENGYSYGHHADQLPPEDPATLCEEKTDALHPALFDFRVHVEQKLGIEDYTYDGDREVQAIIYHQNGNRTQLDCSDAPAYIHSHEETVSMAFWEPEHPATHESTTDCARKVERAMAAIQNETNAS